jgi:hypothetical protein
VLAWVTVALVSVGSLVGLVLVGEPTGKPLPPPTAQVSVAGQLGLEVLRSLPVHPAGTLLGYSRDQFGPAWQDVDHNGCDTRNDILARDMTQVVRPRGCQVTSGTLADPYTGKTIVWVRGPQSTRVQIDHVVALADAWRTGAAVLSPGERLALANDPLNLLAVDGPTNESKGDKNASAWLPRASFQCTYVLGQIQVKQKYKLWVTPAEQTALSNVLRTCPS